MEAVKIGFLRVRPLKFLWSVLWVGIAIHFFGLGVLIPMIAIGLDYKL